MKHIEIEGPVLEIGNHEDPKARFFLSDRCSGIRTLEKTEFEKSAGPETRLITFVFEDSAIYPQDVFFAGDEAEGVTVPRNSGLFATGTDEFTIVPGYAEG